MLDSLASVADRAKRAGPLASIRVLDLTQFLSGPFSTQILGDLGAEVIKVEPPQGDPTRQFPPYFVEGDSAYFLSVNRNKRSIAVNTKTEEGRRVLLELAKASDVVIENFRPGVVRRLGLSYEALAASKPSVVWCSISGFGQDGPYRDRPAYDMIVQAMSGGMSLTGDPAGRPVRSGVPIGDLAAGMYATIGVLAAILESQKTGKGKSIDIAMLDCQVALLSYQAAYHLVSGVVPGRQGSGHDSIPTYRTFVCEDGVDVAVTAITERMWQSLCQVLGLPELPQDSRFETDQKRYLNRVELWSILEPRFQTRTASEWTETLLAAEVPAAAVNALDVTLSDPHVKFREMVLDLTAPAGPSARLAGNPLKFIGDPEREHTYPPKLGLDGECILREVLGYTTAQIDSLRESQAL